MSTVHQDGRTLESRRGSDGARGRDSRCATGPVDIARSVASFNAVY